MHASTGGAVCNSSGARLHASGVGSSLAAPQNTKKTGQLSEEQKKRPINRYTTNNTKKQTQMIFQQIYRGEKSDTDGAPWTCPTAKKMPNEKKKNPARKDQHQFPSGRRRLAIAYQVHRRARRYRARARKQKKSAQAQEAKKKKRSECL